MLRWDASLYFQRDDLIRLSLSHYSWQEPRDQTREAAPTPAAPPAHTCTHATQKSLMSKHSYMSALSINAMSMEILLQRSLPGGAARQRGEKCVWNNRGRFQSCPPRLPFQKPASWADNPHHRSGTDPRASAAIDFLFYTPLISILVI